jgi:hypothetical protein
MKKQRNWANYTISIVICPRLPVSLHSRHKENKCINLPSPLYAHTRGKRKFQKLSFYGLVILNLNLHEWNIDVRTGSGYGALAAFYNCGH